jgi:dihydroneopterin aldolase
MTRPPSPLHLPGVVDGRGRPLDVIELRGLRVHCIVGVYPKERGTPQVLEVDVALHLDTRSAGEGGAIRNSVDYARLAGELRFLLESAAFRLLESAAEALCRYIVAPPTQDGARAQVQAVTLRLAKPEALEGAARPSLTVHRTPDDFRYEREEKPFGEVDVIYQDRAVGIYRLRIGPGKSIVTHEHRQMEEAEMVLGGGLLLQGQPVPPGTAFRWPRHFPHRYDNPQDAEQTVLCVDRPAFIPEDEVEVPVPEGGLQVLHGVSYYPSGEGGQQ